MAGYLLKKNKINYKARRKQLYYADGSLDYLTFIQETEYRENAAPCYQTIEFTNIIKYIESIFLEKIKLHLPNDGIIKNMCKFIFSCNTVNLFIQCKH